MQIVPLAILIALPSVLVKLASALNKTRLTWKHCFIFGSVVTIFGLINRAISSHAGHALALPLAIIISVTVYLLFGSWYFSSRGVTQDGKPVGIRGAVKLMIIFVLLLGILGGLSFGFLFMLRGVPR